MALVTTVTVTTVGGTTFTFSGDAGLSAMRSIAQGIQIDAMGESSGNEARIIIPFESINHALTEIETAETEPVEDANCVTDEGGDK